MMRCSKKEGVSIKKSPEQEYRQAEEKDGKEWELRG